jgi:4-methoxybenzoate monooxygenase (O-demethylating)
MTAAQLTRNAPSSPLDPYSEAFLADPYPFHEQLRELGPVVYLETYGVWGLARHTQVMAALADWETYSSGAGAGMQDLRHQAAWRPRSLVLEADPPLHDATRGVLSRVLSGPAVRKLRAPFEAEAERLVEELVQRGTFDAVQDLAIPYPLKVVGDAVGVPPEGRECLLPFGNMLFNSFGPNNAIFEQSTKEASAVLPQLFAQCERGALASGSFGAEIFAQADAGRVSQEQAPSLVRSLLSAGFDTTVTGLSSMLYAFATHPEQWRILRSEPALHKTAFDEVLRWESPAQNFYRTTTRPVEIAGLTIPADAKVLLFLSSANRDPRRWDNPDSFDVRRNTHGHVALGHGIHVCVGQMIARLETELLIAAFAKRVSRFEIAGPAVRRPNNTLRGFATLPVKVTRAG